MLNLILGRAGTGKTRYVLSGMKEKGEIRSQILIVPEQYSHETERLVCQVMNSPSTEKVEVLTFSRLYSRICDRIGGGAASALDAGGQILLMRRAVKSVEESLSTYRNYYRKKSFLAGLVDTIAEFKSYQITPEDLLEIADQARELEAQKLHDLSLIFTAYNHLSENCIADPSDKLARLAKSIPQAHWPTGFDVWVNYFTDFTPQELDVLESLLNQNVSVNVALTCDTMESSDDDVFAHARHTAFELERIAKKAKIDFYKTTLLNDESNSPALAHLERALFAQEEPTYDGDSSAVALFAADDPRSEVEYAAATILNLVREKGWHYRDFAVTARNFERYADHVESVFKSYAINLFLGTKTDVMRRPVMTLITAAMDTVAGGFRNEDLFRYLKTGMTGFETEECDLLENYAITWNLRGSRWTKDEPWTMHPDGYGLQFQKKDEEALARLNASRERIRETFALMHRGVQTVAEHTGDLLRFLEKISLQETLTNRVEELNEAGELRLADEYRQLWEIIANAMEQCVNSMGDMTMDLEEFSGIFKLVLSQYSVGTIPMKLDAVTAGDAPRMTHKRAKMLILLGADDGSIPAVAPAKGLLTDTEREEYIDLGLKLNPVSANKISREMTLIYDLCAVPSERLLVTWPRAGERPGEERRPSFLVERLALLFPDARWIEQGDLNNSFRLAAPEPALDLVGQYPVIASAMEGIRQYEVKLDSLRGAADQKRGSLSRVAVEELYGQKVPMSATRMDACRACHFSYFMRYGLKAKARQQAGFHAPEYGTFVHYVLEHVLDSLKEDPAGDVKALTDLAVERYINEELGGMKGETPRFRYLFRRLQSTVAFVVKNAVDELQVSQFRPVAFELGFGRGQELPPIEVGKDGLTVSVTGFVDRADGWEHDGKLYLRVVDYKTGRKSFDFTDIQNGMSLQMLLYLFALERHGLMGKDVESAGVLYVHARDVVINGNRDMTQEECGKVLQENVRREGLILNNEQVLRAMEDWGEGTPKFLPLKVDKNGNLKSDYLVEVEQMGKLARKVTKTLEDIAAEMAHGNIDADPYWRSPDLNACRWCDYADACHFEECFGDRKVWQKPVKPDEFWKQLNDADANE